MNKSFHFLAVTGMEAEEPVVACVILWPCIFGFIGVWRTLRSMCQLQLAHAALERGVCLTQPASAHVFDLFMALGMLGPRLDMKETYSRNIAWNHLALDVLVHTRAFPTSIVLGQVNGWIPCAENRVSECEVSFQPINLDPWTMDASLRSSFCTQGR